MRFNLFQDEDRFAVIMGRLVATGVLSRVPAFEQLALAGRNPLDFSCVMGYWSEVPQKSPSD